METSHLFSKVTVLALEQAIVVPYFTYKMVIDGANVIRLEHPINHDPNRLVGDRVIDEDKMNSYFLTINSGKKCVTLNLKSKKGQALLYDMIKSLDVDIFITNQLPKNYDTLGISYDKISSVKEDIIWVGVTGFGKDSNEGAYDPILQARAALMDLTGEASGDPQVIGIPLPDMGSSEQIYGLVMKALFKKAVTSKGSRIDFSMFRSSVSWHAINIPMVSSFNKKITRRGNTHEFFAPVSVYKTKDSYIYIAIGNNRQWEDFSKLQTFSSLDIPDYKLNEGRIKDVTNLNNKINKITSSLYTDELLQMLKEITVPSSKINSLEDLLSDPHLDNKFLKSIDKDKNLEIKLSPPAYDTDFINDSRTLSFPPRLGEHNIEIYRDILKISDDQLLQLKNEGVI